MKKQLKITAAQEAEEVRGEMCASAADAAEHVEFDDSPLETVEIDTAAWKMDYVRMDVFGETL